MSSRASDREIPPHTLQERITRGEKITLLDVREGAERDIATIGGLHIPLDQLIGRIGEIPRDHDVIIYCRSGARSGRAVEVLQRDYGFANLYNLAGGILRWAEEVDPSLTRY